MSSIAVEGLTKRYAARGPAAVEGLSLDVAQGAIAALLGPSGCGKTTTLKLIAGLLGPDRGDIRFDGRSVLDIPAERRGAVMVFQEHALFPFLSAGANVAFGLKLRGLPKRQIQERVERMLELVRLPGMSARMPRELSGGQRQRVALARALVVEPRLLLLDEPLANLDAHLRDEMRNLIKAAQGQTGITTLVVTHDQEEAVMLADRIALMFDGRLRQYGASRDLFFKPRGEKAARFFGGKNFIPSVKTGRTLRTPLGSFEADPVLAAEMPEGPGVLTIRPEHIVIRAAANGGVNALRARLTQCVFMGTHTRCIFEAGGVSLEALENAGDTCLTKDEVTDLYFPPERIWHMPPDLG